jgi:salicylate synthetase
MSESVIQNPATPNVEYPHTFRMAAHLDPLRMAEDLVKPEADFWLYENNDSTLVAIGSIGRVVASDGRIEAFWNGDRISSEKLSEPFRQTGEQLNNLPIKNWRALGYFAFDAAGYYYPYSKTNSIQLDFVIPRTLIEVRPLAIDVRTFEEPAEIIVPNIEKWVAEHTHEEPNTPAPSRADRRAYMSGVEDIIRDIKAGHLTKAILSRSVRLPGSIDLFSTYEVISRANPAARTYAFRQPGLSAIGSSPELLMQTTADGYILTNPLAGTRPRGADKQEDKTMKRELATDAKEVKEHAMSVQLAEAELLRICEVGSVSVKEFMKAIPFRTVWHLGSSVVGQLAEGRSLWDGLRELFPGVTVSGIDKHTAIQKIAELEQESRGLYAGAVGWVGSDGAADLAIALRSAFEDKNGVSMRAGAGIIAESVPELEYEETVNKMRTIQEKLVLR